ncbi:MAG TPA: glycosyltransferase family 39 protein [Terracidiphilus sp.]|nr:glycosyltransferase family 39 protein [Terracidiphilus sp.]
MHDTRLGPLVQSSRRLQLSDTAALWLMGFGFMLLHLVAGMRYGFHRDELLSFNNALDLEWGYVVYPPITAWLGRIELVLFGTSLPGFRVLPAVASGLLAVLTGLIARDLGGGRKAMLVAGFAASIGGSTLFAGSFMSYMSFDLLWWVGAAWCVARLLRTGDGRWWLGVGAFIGLGLMTKYTMAFFALGTLGGMLLTENRRHLRSGWFWAAVALAMAIVAPNIWWQQQHHLAGLAWMKSIHARDIRLGRTDYFLLNQLWKVAQPVTTPIWVAGLWFLFGETKGERYRMLGWMYIITLLGLWAARGRDYYVGPAYPMLMAAGAVWGEKWLQSLRPSAQARAFRATWITLMVGAVTVATLVMPVAPVNSAWWRIADTANGGNFNMQIGWPELARTVADVVASLPPDQRARLGVIAGDEGSAGAVNLYGAAYGLPRAISGMNSNWLRGYGDPPPETLIAVGMDPDFLERHFTSCRAAARLTNSYGLTNDTIGKYTTVFLCGPPRAGWPEFWEHFQYYG